MCTCLYLSKIKITFFEHFSDVLFELLKNPPLPPKHFSSRSDQALKKYMYDPPLSQLLGQNHRGGGDTPPPPSILDKKKAQSG